MKQIILLACLCWTTYAGAEIVCSGTEIYPIMSKVEPRQTSIIIEIGKEKEKKMEIITPYATFKVSPRPTSYVATNWKGDKMESNLVFDRFTGRIDILFPRHGWNVNFQGTCKNQEAKF